MTFLVWIAFANYYVCHIMTFVALWCLSHYDVCRLWRMSPYDVCRLITFVALWRLSLIVFVALLHLSHYYSMFVTLLCLTSIMTFVAYCVCRIITFVALLRLLHYYSMFVTLWHLSHYYVWRQLWRLSLIGFVAVSVIPLIWIWMKLTAWILMLPSVASFELQSLFMRNSVYFWDRANLKYLFSTFLYVFMWRIRLFLAQLSLKGFEVYRMLLDIEHDVFMLHFKWWRYYLALCDDIFDNFTLHIWRNFTSHRVLQ